jgi:hypothetical protein
MDDDTIARLLDDAVRDLEPADRLGEIRARVGQRRPRLAWYAGGGAVLAVAATVTAIALISTSNAPRAVDPGPLAPPSSAATSEPTQNPGIRPHAAYFIGDTANGPRLYREFQSRPPIGMPLPMLEDGPDDPDYRSPWPEGAFADWQREGDIVVVTLADASLRERPAGMSPAEAEVAIQQVVYTLHAELGERPPVQFRFGENPIDQVFGVPTSEPLAAAPPLDVLARVSLSDPAEGLVVAADSILVVNGVGNSFEANFVWRLQPDGGIPAVTVAEGFFTAEGYQEPRLFPFSGEIDLTGIAPGRYLLVVSTDDPSGEGRFDTDTRTIVIT